MTLEKPIGRIHMTQVLDLPSYTKNPSSPMR